MKDRSYTLLTALLGIVLGVLATLVVVKYTDSRKKFDGDYNRWRKLNLILQEVQQNYVDTIDMKAMTDAAVVAALVVAFLGIPVVGPLAKAIRSMGNMAVPFMLLLIGIALAQCWRRIWTHKFDMTYLTLVRLLVSPVLIGAVLKLLPLPADVLLVTLVVALMPAASSSVLVARRYGGCEDFAGQAIIITTLISLLTIPLLLRMFLGEAGV